MQSERKAASIYDKRAILARGLQAKTNFSYIKKCVEQILADEDHPIEYEINRAQEDSEEELSKHSESADTKETRNERDE